MSRHMRAGRERLIARCTCSVTLICCTVLTIGPGRAAGDETDPQSIEPTDAAAGETTDDSGVGNTVKPDGTMQAESPHEPPPLIADAGGDVETPLDETVVLNASGSYSTVGSAIVDYTWYFGLLDETKQYARGSVIDWRFDEPGVHLVMLTVKDDCGNYAEDMALVTVLGSPEEWPTPGCGTLCGPLGVWTMMFTFCSLMIARANVRRRAPPTRDPSSS